VPPSTSDARAPHGEAATPLWLRHEKRLHLTLQAVSPYAARDAKHADRALSRSRRADRLLLALAQGARADPGRALDALAARDVARGPGAAPVAAR
jgi:hypothetical protein